MLYLLISLANQNLLDKSSLKGVTNATPTPFKLLIVNCVIKINLFKISENL